MSAMHTLLIVLLSCLVLTDAAAGADTAAPKASDPRAVAVADQVLEALGGKSAWDATRYLRFDFAVEVDGKPVMTRSHWWDKYTGRYRLEARTKEGDPYLVLMNLNTKQGSAWLKGRALQADELKSYLDKGYAIWVNDTYWLLMPYKMKDSGVILRLDGEAREGGAAWDKVLLTFDNVGLTPKDRYWAYVNRASHLVDRWEFILQGEKGPASRFDWSGWQRYGRIMLSSTRVNAKDKEKILFPVLAVSQSMPDSVFRSPDPVSADLTTP
jgi:hypothetical protein